MSIIAWPFLVSRNKTVGFTTIVAPAFLSLRMLLAEAAGGDVDEPGKATYREIHGSQGERLTLIFRVISAEKRSLGFEGNGSLEDEFGRPIRLIEGLVFQQLMPDIAITEQDMQHVHELIIEPYRAFWENDSASFTLPSFPLHPADASDKRLVLQKKDPFIRESQLVDEQTSPDAGPLPSWLFLLIVVGCILGIVLIVGKIMYR